MAHFSVNHPARPLYRAFAALVGLYILVFGVIGTVATLTAVVHDQGWTFDAASVVIAGIGLTFGMWWVYFVIPTADLLHARRERSFPWGYLHILVFGAIVATGAGLHAAAYYLEHHSTLDSMSTVLAVAVPVGVYLLLICALYVLLVGRFDLFHAGLLTVAVLVLAGAVAMAATGVDMAICLLVVTLAPAVTVLGYELVGHRRATASLVRD